MRVITIWAGLLLACGKGPAEAEGEGADAGGVTDDTDDTSPPVGDAGRCAPGMVGVPNEAPAYCIDAYEVQVIDGIAVSAAGQIPSDLITFTEAKALCAATPMVDEAGTVRGYKHLVTSDEWEDAGDNVVGAGGTNYPYGDAWMEGVCATGLESGAPGYEETLASGAMPDCVSSFGVYDQVGNLWEWMDPGSVVDEARALVRFAELGASVSVDGSHHIVGEGDVSGLRLSVIGVVPGEVELVEGRLFVSAEQVTLAYPSKGYLSGAHDLPDLGWLAVEIELIDGGAGGAWINSDPGRDGWDIPDKRGCAYYVGWGNACELDNAALFHTADFRGSIGFRCAAPPMDVAAEGGA